MNRKIFYQALRPALFRKGLQQVQVDRLEAILNELENTGTDLYQEAWAYVLATGYHEARQYLAYSEEGGDTYLQRMYDPEFNPTTAKRLGNTQKGDGIKFKARGPAGLTGRWNYYAQGKKLNLPLVDRPELAEQADIAAKIMVRGMIDGAFRRDEQGEPYHLARYFNDKTIDFVNARNIINGKLDRADVVASYAEQFNAALQVAFDAEAEASHEKEPLEAEIVEQAEEKESLHFNFPEATANDADAEPSYQKPWWSGWKTYLIAALTGGVGVAAILGYIPGLSAEAGAMLLQQALIGAGIRSAMSHMVLRALIFYLQQQNRGKT